VTNPGPTDGLVASDPPDATGLVDDPAPADDASPATPAAAWTGPSTGRWVLFATIAIGVLVLDQLSKAWITSNLDIGEGIEILGEWLRLVHWRNSGALFGLLPQSAMIFAVVSIGVVGLIVVYHRKAGRGIVTTVALALLLGGAVGNLIDRLRYGSVVDFVDMGIGQWRFYTYNVADAAITTAIVLLIAMAVFPRIGEWGADGG
jgi:signal peptidase II